MVETLPRLLGRDPTGLGSAALVRGALTAVSAGLRDEAHGRIGREGMGAATVVALVTRDQATIGHLGDSRAYRLRGGELELLTRDHTLAELLVVTGRIEPALVTDHPARHRLTRYVGMPGEPLADVRSVTLAPGDRLLLSSDGLTALVPDTELAAILAGAPHPQQACRRLIDAANEAGGEDNVTAVVIVVA